MVFCLEEQFVQTDTRISSFQIGIHLSSVTYTNISNDTLSGFPFPPINHSRNKPYGGETNSPSPFQGCEQTCWGDMFSKSQSLPSIQYPLNWSTQLSWLFDFPECCRGNLFSSHGLKKIRIQVLYWSVNNMKLSSNQWSVAFEISNSNTIGKLPN